MVRGPVSAYLFSLRLCGILTNTQLNCAVTRVTELYVSEVFYALLARLEMRVTQIFPLLFLNSFFFIYWKSDLEVSC